uniref:G domain-containing protein n=1 Tax=Panagrolaimus sp. PS1159 TaxID=55785 RepID=A0AC35GU78_9BILA
MASRNNAFIDSDGSENDMNSVTNIQHPKSYPNQSQTGYSALQNEPSYQTPSHQQSLNPMLYMAAQQPNLAHQQYTSHSHAHENYSNSQQPENNPHNRTANFVGPNSMSALSENRPYDSVSQITLQPAPQFPQNSQYSMQKPPGNLPYPDIQNNLSHTQLLKNNAANPISNFTLSNSTNPSTTPYQAPPISVPAQYSYTSQFSAQSQPESQTPLTNFNPQNCGSQNHSNNLPTKNYAPNTAVNHGGLSTTLYQTPPVPSPAQPQHPYSNPFDWRNDQNPQLYPQPQSDDFRNYSSNLPIKNNLPNPTSIYGPANTPSSALHQNPLYPPPGHQQPAMLMQQMQLQQAQPNGNMQGLPGGQNTSGYPYFGNVPNGKSKHSAKAPKDNTSNVTRPPLPQPRKIVQSVHAVSSGPRKEIYILVLGETGVGKSTWINGIANYMSFDVITEALEAPEPVCVIPSKFTMCDDNYQQREIVIGNSTNEVFDKGQSATQDARTYLFVTPKYDVYIIDTPGIGDVRGIEQDKENTRKILNAIAPYKNLHAICILFKSNEARMTLSFRYCISELLLQLHRDAAKNIVFFFTNSRGTFYKPGDTIVPLRAFLDELHKTHGIQVALDKNNIFCLDNEAFKFVCAFHDGFEFTEADMLNFAGSWKLSAEETHRFLDFAAASNPHSVDKTLSVNQARGIILQLAKPLADINDLIETNIKVYNDRKLEIENTAATIDDLKNKLLIPQVGIQTEELDYPMTVCTGSKCIETQSIPNSEQLQTIYSQICHDHCQLDNVDPERFPEPHLQQCWAMQGGQTCSQCQCNWSTHMHIRFKQVKTNDNVEDPNIRNAIQTNEDARITKQKMIETCEQTVEEYKHEQKIIMDASIRFAVFLKQNAIMAYNDVFEKYVEKSIEEEEKCIRAGGDNTKLNNLKRCLDEYRQERAAIEHAIQSGGNAPQQITTDDVKNMKTELFALPHFGAKLKELFNRTVQGYAMNQQQSVQKFSRPNFSSYPNNGRTRKPAKTNNMVEKLRNMIMGKPSSYYG